MICLESQEYLDLRAVFSRSRATSLPPHRPYDCSIDLLPGTMPPRGRLYSLSAPEREALEKYLTESLAAQIIVPSSSPAGAGFFFVKKKDGSLRPCIDYRGERHNGQESVSVASYVVSLRDLAGRKDLHEVGLAQRVPSRAY